MSDKNDSAESVKVVLIGEMGVGKTCIIARFINNIFERDTVTTTGANFAGKTMIFEEYGNKCLKFEIWDTAGQEQYRALTKIFYKDAKIAILVYDITRRQTFEQIKGYWYEQIKETAPDDLIIAIAANKCDLYDNEEVKEEEGREFAEKIGAFYKLTSASSNQGIEELFKTVGNRFLDPNYSFNTSGKNKNLKIGGDTPNIKKKKKCC